ncbi:MAG: ABC transporter permease, partial [Promethearchaeota archaeon]
SLLLSAFSVGSSLRMNTSEYMREATTPIDITVSSTRWDSPIDTNLVEAVTRDFHVVRTIQRIEETVQIQNGTDWIHLLLIGLDPGQEQHIGGFHVTEGTADINGSFCFLSDTAMRLANLSLGEQIQLYTSAGIHFVEVVGHGSALDKGVIGPSIFIHIDRAWDIYGVRYPRNSSNKLIVEVDDVFAIPATVNRLTALFGEHYIVSNQKSYDLWVASNFLDQADLILASLVMGAFFVAALRVFSSYSLIFSERKFETGLMRAYGAESTEVFTVLLSELSVVGMAGAIVGVCAGIVTSSILSNLVNAIIVIHSPISPDVFLQPNVFTNPFLLLAACLAGILLTMAAGSIPALTATRQRVVESLKHARSGVSNPVMIPSNAVRIARIVFLVVGCVMGVLVIYQYSSDILHLGYARSDSIRLLSIPTIIILTAILSERLARPTSFVNAIKNRTRPVIRSMFSQSLRRRSTGALLIFNLFVSVTLLLLLSSNVSYTITSSWENTLGWQSSSTNVVSYIDDTATPDAIEAIRNQQNVSEISEMCNIYEFARHESNIHLSVVFGIQPESFQNLASVGLLESMNMSRGLTILDEPGSCVLSEFAADAFNVGIGGQIEIAERVNLTVVAICESSAPIFLFTFINPIFIFVDTDIWESVADEPFEPDGILLDSLNPESTIANLTGIPGVYPVLVSAVVQDYSGGLESFRLTIDLSLAFLLVAVVISAILSGWSAATARRREMGMLRALGMEGEEIAKILTLESAVPMATGVIWGVLVGILANISLADIIMRVSGGAFTFVDYRAILIVIVSLVLSLAASYFASHRATMAPTIDLLGDRQRT